MGGTKGSMKTPFMGFSEGSPGNIGMPLFKKAPFQISSPPNVVINEEFNKCKVVMKKKKIFCL